MTIHHALWALSLLLFVGATQKSLRTVCLALPNATVWIADQAHAWAVHTLGRLRAAASRRLDELALGPDGWRAGYLVGTLVSSAACTLFLAAEGAGVIWSMDALGVGSMNLPLILQRADVILTGSWSAAGAWAGWAAHALNEEGSSQLVVFAWLTARTRSALRRMAATAFGLVVLAVIGLGTLRARALVIAEAAEAQAATVAIDQGPEARPEPGSESVQAPDRVVTVIRYLVSTAGAASLTLVSVVAWQFGPAQGAAMTGFLATWLLVILVGGIRWAIAVAWALLRAIRALLTHILDAVMAIATILVRPPVALLRTLHTWAEDRAEDHGIVRGCKAGLAALAAVAWDIQVPRPGAWVDQVDPIRVARDRTRRAA